jgi:NADH-quinone oxidoreductase subunit E
MLTQKEQEEIAMAAAPYEHRQAVCLEALKIVQYHRGWVNDEALRAVARFLEMSPDQAESVATFYNLIFRKPVGRHVILVCNSVSCWILGYEALLHRLRERWGIGFGETTVDGRFTLLPAACLGACDRAPVLMIDGELHGNVEPEALDALLARYP